MKGDHNLHGLVEFSPDIADTRPETGVVSQPAGCLYPQLLETLPDREIPLVNGLDIFWIAVQLLSIADELRIFE